MRVPPLPPLILMAVYAAEDASGITAREFLSPSRVPELSFVRSAIVVGLRRAGRSWRDCARAINRTDHTTAISLYNRGVEWHVHTARCKEFKKIARAVRDAATPERVA